jgi:hypothetical protein
MSEADAGAAAGRGARGAGGVSQGARGARRLGAGGAAARLAGGGVAARAGRAGRGLTEGAAGAHCTRVHPPRRPASPLLRARRMPRVLEALLWPVVWVLVRVLGPVVLVREARLAAAARARRAGDAMSASDADRAALRAENARLENAVALRNSRLDVMGAQVAALVQALTDAAAAVRGIGERDIWLQRLREWDALLDAPDLAALGAQEQARDAVIAAARACLPEGMKVGEWRPLPVKQLREALAALDALRARMTP